MAEHDLDAIYREAQSAFKSRDYIRASELLRQILVIDENYRDVSRLLAQTVKLKRRRWYNDPRLWGALGFTIIVALGFFIAPRLRGLYAIQPSVAVTDTISPTATLPPTAIAAAAETLLPTPTSIPLTWKRFSIGQEFERDTVIAFVIDPKDQDVLYAGMKNAGIYKSIDGGLSWRPAHFGISNTQVKSLSIDPQSPRILYAGTMDGLFKTENSGENWSKIGDESYLLMDPQDSFHLYARDSDKVRESTDQGKSWKIIYSATGDCPDKIYSWAIHPKDGKTLFMIGGGKCDWGVYMSIDGGQSWALIPSSKFELPAYEVNILDYGVDKLAVGLDGQGNLKIHPYETAAYDSMGSLYTYWDAHLRKSNPGDEQAITLGKPDVETGENMVAIIAISPFDPNTIYLGGRGISVSKDSGQTWEKLSNGLGAMFVTLETGGGKPPILYLQEECDTSFFPYLEERFGYFDKHGRQEPGQPLFISQNGGEMWDLVSQTGCYLIKDADDITLYRLARAIQYCEGCESHDSWIWRSQNGGQTWKKIMALHGWTPLTLVAHPTQSGKIYMTAAGPDYDPYQEFISEDYGYTWKRIDSLVSTKTCYGSTFQFIDKYRPMAVDPIDGNHVFVIDNGILLESHNSCDTTETFATTPNTSMNSIAFDPNKSGTIYAGTDGGAYISFDAGKTWGQVNDGLLGATVVYSIAVDKDSNVYAATPYGVFKLEGK